MTAASGTALFYVVFIAPGFIAVFLAISLAAVERDTPQFNLLAFSLVSSLFIDAVFIGVYQHIAAPVRSPAALSNVLFTPRVRVDLILIVFAFAVLLGILYAILILLDAPDRARRAVQSRSNITLTLRQPWSKFMRDARTVLVETNDEELYWGHIIEWSRAEKPQQLRIGDPRQYFPNDDSYEPVDLGDMLFFENNIKRLTIFEWEEPVETETRTEPGIDD